MKSNSIKMHYSIATAQVTSVEIYDSRELEVAEKYGATTRREGSDTYIYRDAVVGGVDQPSAWPARA
jgi:hypothetical protein